MLTSRDKCFPLLSFLFKHWSLGGYSCILIIWCVTIRDNQCLDHVFRVRKWPLICSLTCYLIKSKLYEHKYLLINKLFSVMHTHITLTHNPCIKGFCDRGSRITWYQRKLTRVQHVQKTILIVNMEFLYLNTFLFNIFFLFFFRIHLNHT